MVPIKKRYNTIIQDSFEAEESIKMKFFCLTHFVLYISVVYLIYAWNVIWIGLIWAWDLPDIYVILARDIPNIYLRFVWNVSDICVKYKCDIPDIFIIYAEIYLTYAYISHMYTRDMLENCKRYCLENVIPRMGSYLDISRNVSHILYSFTKKWIHNESSK